MKRSSLMVLVCSLATLVAAVQQFNPEDKLWLAQLMDAERVKVCTSCAKLCLNRKAKVGADPDFLSKLVQMLNDHQPYVSEQCPAICTEFLQRVLGERIEGAKELIWRRHIARQLTRARRDDFLDVCNYLQLRISDYTCDYAFDVNGNTGPDDSGSGETSAKGFGVQQSQGKKKGGSKKQNQKGQQKSSLDTVFAVPRLDDTGSGGSGGSDGGSDGKTIPKTAAKASKELVRSNFAKFGSQPPGTAGGAAGRGVFGDVGDFVNNVALPAAGAVGLGAVEAARRVGWGGAY